ncbi:RNA polymerase sigma factor [Tenacibaculum sp. UWU-22]|uniref:RNA polymerase sigma factor n=1 Tax=Tenacibaculum sp. UWU-22 TaxID=3234187 RepID=UPI0034DAC4B1
MKEQPLHITKLVERCKFNDQNAQLELYKAYFKAMYNTAFRILKEEFEAEDIVQESFLTAFTKLDTYREEVTFGAWLKRIVINKSLTQLKKNNRYKEVKMEVVLSQEIEETTIEYSKLEVKKVLDCINKLKDNYRLVITLHLIEGYDYEEIAQIMNYSNENVRTTISRAKKKIKQVLLTEINAKV